MGTTKKHILIVDDEESLAFFLSERLADAGSGFEVEIAHSAPEAALKIKERPPDLVITDLRMPGVDGLQLSNWIRTKHPDTRLILMTAYGNDQVEAEARRLQVYRYITKPFQIEDLVTAAREALGELAISGRGVLALSDESFGAITVALEALRVDVGARCVLLADSMGQLVTRTGAVHDLDMTLLLALLGNTFLANLELAHRLNETRPAGFNYLECQQLDVYAVIVDQGLFLTLIFDKGMEASRVGTVWFYARQTANKLAQMLKTKNQLPSAAETTLTADFGASLASELDNMLVEIQEDLEPAGASEPPALLKGNSASGDADDGRPPWLNDYLFPLSTEPGLLDIEAAIERGLINPETAESLRGGRTTP